MSDSVRPHGLQPTRLFRPWDSPGKNTGVGCHFLFQCMKVKSESEVAQLCPTLSDPMDCSLPGSTIHGIFQAKIAIAVYQMLNINDRMIHEMQGKVKVAQSCPTLCDPMDYKAHGILQARILEWVTFQFSRESSQPRD